MRRTAILLSALVPLLILGLMAAAGVLAGGGCHGSVTATPSEANGDVVKIDGCTYLPTITRVPVGSQVRFINSSTGPHDITGRMGSWASGPLEVGAEFRYRFATAGVYPYSCSLHPGMAGVVVVGSTDVALSNDGRPAAALAPTTAPAEAASPLPAVAAAGGIGLLTGVLGALVVTRRRAASD